MATPPTPHRPLSFNSPRASPFRRPQSPLAPSPSTIRVNHTPSTSPTKVGTPSGFSPEKPHSPLRNSTGHGERPSWLNRGHFARHSSDLSKDTTLNDAPTSPTHRLSSSLTRLSATEPEIKEKESNPEREPTKASVPTAPTPALSSPFRSSATAPLPKVSTPAAKISTPLANSSSPLAHLTPSPGHLRSPNDPLSKIPPQLLHSMRESFSVLDYNNTGQINSADLSDALAQLGLDTSSSSLSAYFPTPSSTINLATYLKTLAELLAPLSSAQELQNAFEAFDVDDSGEIDVTELKDALLNTAPEKGEPKLSEREVDRILQEFGGRRAFGKKKKNGPTAGRGEVFRYIEFIGGVSGGGKMQEGETRI